MTAATKAGYALTGLLMLGGLVAFGFQLREGLILTDMQNSYSWGLYVSGLAFFVGNAAGGLVLTSLIYLFGVTQLKPFAKLGALTAFANVTAAMLSVLPDMGQPMRLYQMLLHPNFMSPLVWDIIVLTLYALLSLSYLYLLMLPELTGRLARIAIQVEDPQAFADRWARRLAPFSLVAAVGIHVVTAWIFATQGARDWWNTSVLAPDFVAVALASGTSLVLMVAVLSHGIRDQHRDAYRVMALIIAASLFVHLFFMYNDFVIHAWYGADEAMETLAIVFGQYGLTHAFEVLAPLAAVVLLLSQRVRKSAVGIVSSCLLLILGVFAHRFMLMPAAFDRVPLTLSPLGLQHAQWSAPIASGRYAEGLNSFVTEWHYFPTMVEIAIFLGAVAYVGFLLILAIDRLPIVKQATR